MKLFTWNGKRQGDNLGQRKLLLNQRLLMFSGHLDSQGSPPLIATSAPRMAHPASSFRDALNCTVAIRISEGMKPRPLPQVGTYCCCLPLSAQWIQLKLNPPVFQPLLSFVPHPSWLSVLLSSHETPEISPPQALLLGTQTQDTLSNNHIAHNLHSLYALRAQWLIKTNSQGRTQWWNYQTVL